MAALSPTLLALLLVLAQQQLPSDALMFHSNAVSKQWDTWVFVENGTFYAYYLVTEVSFGEGFGVGTSTDGVHFTDHGYVWHGPSWWNSSLPTSRTDGKRYWEGSSAVWRAADFNKTGRYLINYSQMNTECKCQNITFAESYDLIHWSNGMERGDADEYQWFNIDASLYTTVGGRWDTIYSIPVPGAGQENLRDGYPRYGYWTATPLGGNGTFGFGITDDGSTWKALPSPAMLPEAIGAELGAVEYVKPGVYVAMLGYGWPRTMLAYTAASPTGPFTRNSKNVNFLNGSCYYARFFRGPLPQQELLVTHQTWDNHGTHFSYISPFKTVDVDDEGTFRLMWWPNNEKLKGEPLASTEVANVSQGFFLEANFTLPSMDDSEPTNWPGFLIETKVPGSVYVGMNGRGVASTGIYKSTSAADNFNYTASTKPQSVPTDFEFAGGAASTASKLPGQTDIRSGGPGQTTLALVAHPLFSEGHLITAATVAFSYVSGYGCTTPTACTNAANLSLAIVDAFNHTIIQTIWTSQPLNKYSYDGFKGYSPPVLGGASGLAIGWPRQTQLALVMNNNDRNLQIPADSVNITLSWGGKQPADMPWEPNSTSVTTLQISETWSRDLVYSSGQRVRARLIYRRSMLEMYIDDYLYPVYAMPDATGRFDVSNATIVTGLKAWKLSLPADSNPGGM